MKLITSVAVESIAKEKARHVANAAAGGTAVAVVPDWLGIAGGVAALLVSCAIFYKTYQDIKLNNILLAKEDRRKKSTP